MGGSRASGTGSTYAAASEHFGSNAANAAKADNDNSERANFFIILIWNETAHAHAGNDSAP
jgi:hypothetical protein